MGNFAGHALPGSLFILFAIWWTISIFRRYIKSRTTKNNKFLSTFTFPCDLCKTKASSLEWEGMLKVFVAAADMTTEIYTGFEDGKFVHIGNGHHITMMVFFIISGISDIIVHHKLRSHSEIQYITAALAFIVEGLLFKFHIHGRDELDVLVHTLLIYSIYASIISVLIELRYRNSVLSPLIRTLCVFVQGTWFWQVGFILYNPLPGATPWDPDNHKQLMVITMMFPWHIAADCVIMSAIGALVWMCYKYILHTDIIHVGLDDTMELMKIPHEQGKQYTIINTEMDSDLE